MENPKLIVSRMLNILGGVPPTIKILIPIIILGFFVFGASQALAYGIDTHSFLTNEAVNFYNRSFPNKIISNELKDYLIDGSRWEDRAPRPMNHFYDPVHNRGYSYAPEIDGYMPNLGKWQASKDWSQDRVSQNHPFYKVSATIGSILSAIQQRKISVLLEKTETDFTWQRALDFYASNEKEKAFFALGHIFHLIQDKSVPDHTRNDAHLFDSPYELYADRFNLFSPDLKLSERLKDKKPIILSNLNSYFEELARYSNNNFYSKDTIGIQSGYSLPQPDYFKAEGNFLYGMKKDEIDGTYYRLFIQERTILSSFITNFKNDIVLFNNEKGGDLVMSDYWSRLSTKSIQYTSGIINLFIEEGERLKKERQGITQDSQKNFLSQALGAIGSFADSLINSSRQAFSLMFGGENLELLGRVSLNKNKTNTSLRPFISVEKTSVNQGEIVKIKGQKFSPNKSITLFIKPPKGTVVQKTLIADSKGEFAENYALSSNAALGVYFAYAKDVFSGVSTDRIKFQVLEKTKEQIQIRETEQEENELFVQEKIQIEKKEVQVRETEQEENELFVQEKIQIEKKEVQVPDKVCDFNAIQVPLRQKVIINEIAWMGSTESSGNEWIELKNISGAEINISGWQISDKNGDIKIQFGLKDKIPAGGFYLLERTDDNSVPNVKADIIYTGALSNENEGLKLFDNQCNLIDEALANPKWPAGDAASRRTMERSRNILNWHTSSFVDGMPKQENSESSFSFGGEAATSSSASSTSQSAKQFKIIISEIQITGGTGKTANDFIEIYNPNNFQVNLKGYRLVKRTKSGTSDSSIKSWTSDAFIPANGYYLWVNSNYSDLVSLADVSTSATIAAHNGIAIRFGAANTGVIIDSVGWGTAENAFVENQVFPINPGANQSIQRKLRLEPAEGFIDTNNNAEDFEIQNCPSPKAQSKICQSNPVLENSLIPLKIVEVIFNPEGSDKGKERVVIYNQDDKEESFIDIGSYSVQYLSLGWDFKDLKKKNFRTGQKISSKGFFKIGMNCSAAAPCQGVDLSWSQSLHNDAGVVFLVKNQEKISGVDDFDIVDVHKYGNWPEMNISSFSAAYNPDGLTINFSWSAHPQLIYQIKEYNSPTKIIFEGKEGFYNHKIDEIGRTKNNGNPYVFSIQAFDKFGFKSEIITEEIDVPGFANNLAFHRTLQRDFLGERIFNAVEFSYDDYPFLPNAVLESNQNNQNYKIMVFYLNREAPKRRYLDNAEPLEEDRHSVLRIEYETCAGVRSKRYSLIFPDGPEQCNVQIGGFANSALRYSWYLDEKDNYLSLPVEADASQEFSSSDYITVAFYGFRRDFPQGTNKEYLEGGVWSNFELLAIDKTKYYFQDNYDFSSHKSPLAPEKLNFFFDEVKSILKTSWDKSKDPDTLDNLLHYEISYNGGVDWKNVYGNLLHEKIVESSKVYNIAVRAFDNFNLRSESATARFSFP